jgi:hypothetical protein
MRPLLNGALRIERAIERALGRYSRRKRFVAGTAGLLLIAFVAMGADVWSFERLPPNRFTSMAILTGTWRLRSALSTMGHDEQVFDGAGYTNWGFGVPLFVQVVGRLFDGFFFVTSDATSTWMQQCHVDFEHRPADGWIYPNEVFLGVPVLALLVALAVHAFRDRGFRRLSRLVPLCATAALFFSYARAGVGPAWRTSGR